MILIKDDLHPQVGEQSRGTTATTRAAPAVKAGAFEEDCEAGGKAVGGAEVVGEVRL